MKAIIYTEYGSPEVLHLQDLLKPEPKENQILIKVIATTVNSADCRLRRADPALVRLFFGLLRPKINVLGLTFAGVVEAIGSKVKDYKIGDQIYGMGSKNLGANAEYMVIDPISSIISLKPQRISYQEASSIPFGFTTACYFAKQANIQCGQNILIYGASSAVGIAMLQIAKAKGAVVTTVTSGKNLDLMKSLGADYTINYQTDNFRKSNIKYDIIMDCVNKMGLDNLDNSLNTKAILILCAGLVKEMFQSIRLRKKYNVIIGEADEKLEYLSYANQLIEENKFRVIIDREYNLDQMVEAHTYVETGHKVGSVVININ